jgi:hypothetical protein
MSIQEVNSEFNNLVELYSKENLRWDGDIIDLPINIQDKLCYVFLFNMDSWWDDVMPPCINNQSLFLDSLYDDSNKTSLALLIRSEIYLYLENTIGYIVEESYNLANNIKPEPFPGYERGE